MTRDVQVDYQVVRRKLKRQAGRTPHGLCLLTLMRASKNEDKTLWRFRELRSGYSCTWIGGRFGHVLAVGSWQLPVIEKSKF